MQVGLGLAGAQDTYSCPDGWDKEVTLVTNLNRDLEKWSLRSVDRKTEVGAVAF